VNLEAAVVQKYRRGSNIQGEHAKDEEAHWPLSYLHYQRESLLLLCLPVSIFAFVSLLESSLED